MMKVVLLTSSASNQVALANRISRRLELAGVVVSKNIPQKKRALSLRERAMNLVRKAQSRTFGYAFSEVWKDVQSEYRKEFPVFPTCPILEVQSINDSTVRDFLDRTRPDLILVSGTNMVGPRLIASAPAQIWNLHTGISPYVKGGPNCTNWCLARGWFHLIGNTIMWIDPGIDTGDIVATERTPLEGDEDLKTLHRKVMDHAHDLYIRAALQRANGGSVARTPQASIARGTTFYTREWDGVAMGRALINFNRRYSRSSLRQSDRTGAALSLVPLTSPDPISPG
jgi:methionyl-tRNA formyltransferase